MKKLLLLFFACLLFAVSCKKNESVKLNSDNEIENNATDTLVINEDNGIVISEALDSLEYQNDERFSHLGAGVVQFTNVEAKIQLYADANMQKSIAKNVLGAGLVPFFYKPDYGILFFSCAEENQNNYKIFLKDNKVAYLKKEKHIKYFSWNDFLKNEIVGLSSKDPEANLYADAANGEQIDNSGFSSDDEIDITDVKDNWLQINNKTAKKTYWMKWREGERFLVHLYLLM